MIVYMFCLDVLQALIINSFFSRKCSVYKILDNSDFIITSYCLPRLRSRDVLLVDPRQKIYT